MAHPGLGGVFTADMTGNPVLLGIGGAYDAPICVSPVQRSPSSGRCWVSS